jgi:hypothetical protein
MSIKPRTGRVRVTYAFIKASALDCSAQAMYHALGVAPIR